MSKINKSINLSGLPTYYKGIDWKKSIGYKIPFKYGEIIGELELIEYVNDDLVKIKYKDRVATINKDCIKRCAIGNAIGFYNTNYLYNVGDVIDVNTGKVTILEQINIKDKKNHNHRGYIVRCHNHKVDYDYPTSEQNFKRGHGCPLCTNQVVVKGINDMGTTNPISLKYVANIEDAYSYTCASDKIILFKCPDCGLEKLMKISNFYYDGSSCNRCGDGISYPNKIAFNLLEQLGLDFIPEYSPEWIKPMKYDFYFKLNNKRYILEMDGGWHDRDNNLSGKSKEKANEDDKYKDEMAYQQGINIIRVVSNVSRLENIKENILNSNLNNIVDLSNIDWEKCELYALSSLVKMACDYWNNGIHSTIDIASIMKLNCGTICKYLKKGAKIGLCNYSVEKARSIILKKFTYNNSESKSKPILCIETKQVFRSITLCYKLSEDVFGFKIWMKSLSDHLTGKHKHTHKLHFQYITREEFNQIKSNPETSHLAYGDFFNIQN